MPAVYFRTMRSYRILLLALLLPLLTARAAEDSGRFSVIHVAPARTSIYIGRLTVTPGPFQRTATGYKADLGVDLAPYFYHDDAHVTIEVADAKLGDLQNGKAIDFRGRVIRSNGQSRRLTGRAIPTGPNGGLIEILVYLTSQVTVSFSTTYTVAGTR